MLKCLVGSASRLLWIRWKTKRRGRVVWGGEERQINQSQLKSKACRGIRHWKSHPQCRGNVLWIEPWQTNQMMTQSFTSERCWKSEQNLNLLWLVIILQLVPGDPFRGRKKLYHVLKDVKRLCCTLHHVIQWRKKKTNKIFLVIYLILFKFCVCVLIYAYICLHICNGFFGPGARKLLLIVQVNYTETG